MKILLQTSWTTSVYGDGYGNDIVKVTITASDPTSCFGFMSKNCSVRLQFNQVCNTLFTSGTPGRATLSDDESCEMQANNFGQNFGTHTVNASARPTGRFVMALQMDAVPYLLLGWQDVTGQQWRRLPEKERIPAHFRLCSCWSTFCFLPQSAVPWLVNWLAGNCLNRVRT